MATKVNLLLILLVVVVVQLATKFNQVVGFKLSLHHHHTVEELITKLTTETLEPSKVYKYMSSVEHKDEVKIGKTNLRELVDLHLVCEAGCDGIIFLERIKVCDYASEANIANVNNYCQAQLNKQAQCCASIAGDLFRKKFLHLLSVKETYDTIESLRRFVKNHLNDQQDKGGYKSMIDEFLSGNNDSNEGHRVRKDCKNFKGHMENLMTMLNYAAKQNDGLEMSRGEAHRPDKEVILKGWTHVYEECEYLLSQYESQPKN